MSSLQGVKLFKHSNRHRQGKIWKTLSADIDCFFKDRMIDSDDAVESHYVGLSKGIGNWSEVMNVRVYLVFQ